MVPTLPTMKPYEEIVEFIAEVADTEKLGRFHPSKAAEARVAVLLEKHKKGTLRTAEREEFDQFLRLEHIMRLAKARARKRAGAHAVTSS
jgi:hypothetical protein